MAPTSGSIPEPIHSESDQRFAMSFTKSGRASTHVVAGLYSLDEITEWATSYEVGEKDGSAIIAAVLAPCPAVCRNHGKPRAIDCGGGQQHRLKENVIAMTGIAGDFDHTPLAVFNTLTAALTARGIMHWHWQTFGHQPDADRVKARIIVPFASPLPISNPRQWSNVAWPALNKYLGFEAAQADAACSDPGRVYFGPRKPTAEAIRHAGYQPGAPLDWQPILGEAMEQLAIAATSPAVPAKSEDPFRPVDLVDVKARLARIKKPGTHARIRNVLLGRAPTPPPAVRIPGESSRYLAWRTVTGALAAVAHEWEASNALLEILRPAYRAEVAESPDDHTAWEVIAQLFESARAGIPAFRAQQAAEWEAAKKAFIRSIQVRRAR